jgi:hypothetical protein
MSDIPQLLAAIDGRLAELAVEITALETAKAALDVPRAVGRSRAGAGAAMTARSPDRPRRPPPNVLTHAPRAGRRRHTLRAGRLGA